MVLQAQNRLMTNAWQGFSEHRSTAGITDIRGNAAYGVCRPPVIMFRRWQQGLCRKCRPRAHPHNADPQCKHSDFRLRNNPLQSRGSPVACLRRGKRTLLDFSQDTPPRTLWQLFQQRGDCWLRLRHLPQK